MEMNKEELIETFVKKWSSWYCLEPQVDLLRKAMKREIAEIISSPPPPAQDNINEIAKISIYRIYQKLLPLYDNDLGKAEEHFASLLEDVETDIWDEIRESKPPKPPKGE